MDARKKQTPDMDRKKLGWLYPGAKDDPELLYFL